MRIYKIIGLAFFLMIGASCIIPFVYYPGGGDWTPRFQAFHKVLSLNPGGTISLDNVNGDIDIRGWDREEVEITAEESQGDYYGRRGWYFTGMGGIKPQVEVDQFDQFIKIRAGASKDEENTRPLHFRISVPHSVNLKDILIKSGTIHIADLYGSARVESEEGDITVENFSGSLDLSLVRGSIDAEVLDLRKDDEVRITTKEGDITLHLQPNANIRLEASAANGGISSDFDLGLKLPAQKVSAQVGTAEASASLMTLNGDIRLRKVR
jgi:hypothetical protein